MFCCKYEHEISEIVCINLTNYWVIESFWDKTKCIYIMYSRELSALLKFWTLTSNQLSCLLVWGFYSTSYFLFPQFPLPLPLPDFIGAAGLAAAVALGVLFLCLVGVAPSILATSSSVLLDPPFASLNLPGPTGYLFPVTNPLNCVPWHLNFLAHPVCDAFKLVICSYRTKYMYAAIVLVCSVVLG